MAESKEGNGLTWLGALRVQISRPRAGKRNISTAKAFCYKAVQVKVRLGPAPFFFSFIAGSCLVIDFSMDRVLCRHIAADRSGLSMFDRLVRAFHGGSPTRGSFHKVLLLLQRSLVSSFTYGSSSQKLPSGR